ncbi:dynein heavy chain 10, axonemal, partial [Biomphalaria glabrata]
MDDVRFEWIRDRVYDGLNLLNPAIFEVFLETYESQLSMFLNKGPEKHDNPVSILFYKEKIFIPKVV